MASDERTEERPSFRVLGPLAVELAGTALPPGGRLRRALLADLLLHANRVVSTDQLVEDLWADSPPEDPSNTIQVYVGQLRKMLEPRREPREAATLLVSTPPGYELVVDETDLDALRFEELLSAARTAMAARDWDRAASTLRDALALWRGHALPEFADAPFARSELARLEELRLNALEERITVDLDLGHHSRVVGELEVLTGDFPFRERLWELRLLALYRANRQADALRAYQQARRVLGDELGIEPGPALRQLDRRIVAHDRRLEWAPPSRVTAAPDRHAVPADDFVGRRAELERLEELLSGVEAGGAALAFIVGDAGVGKSRLAAELAARAWASGAIVAAGRCFEGESAPPFAPMLECLRDLAASTSPSSLQREARALSVLARVLPDLHDVADEISEPEPLPPDQDRARLFDSVARVVGAITSEAPALLILDDLQWADPGTLALLGYLARAARSSQLLIIGCYRHREVAPASPVSHGLAAIEREIAPTRLVLPALDAASSAELVGRLLGPRSEPATLARIVARGAGHPFFLRELSNGARDGVLDINAVPSAARELVLQRLHHLPDRCQRLVYAASVFGGPFDLGVAGSAAGLSDSETLDALDRLMLDGFIVPAAGEDDSAEFFHDIARQALYEDLAPPRRSRLHRAVAMAMEHRWPASRQRREAAALAYHYARSIELPDAERGADHATQAASAAEATYANDDVARLLQLAITLLPDGDVRTPRLLLRLARARIATGEQELGAAAARDALAQISHAEGSDVAADLAADAAEFTTRIGAWTATAGLADIGLEYTSADGRAWAWLKTADLLAHGIDDPDWPGIILETPEQLHLSDTLRELPPADRPQGAVLFIAFRSRADVLAAADEPWALAFWGGEFKRALELLPVLARHAEDRGELELAIIHRAAESRCLNALGRFTEADDAYARGAHLVGRLVAPSVFSAHLLSADEERWAALGEGWGQWRLALSGAVDDRWAKWYGVLNRARTARVMANMGAHEEAMAHLQPALSKIDAAPAWAENYTRILHAAAEVGWIADRPDHAALIERNIRGKALDADFRYPMADLRLTLARIVALQGRLDEALDWLAASRVVLDDQGATPLRVIVGHDEAVVLTRMHRAKQASEAFAAARDEAQSLGMHGWVRRAELALASN